MFFRRAAIRLGRYLQCCLILSCLLAFCPGVTGSTPTRGVNRIHLEDFHGSEFDGLGATGVPTGGFGNYLSDATARASFTLGN